MSAPPSRTRTSPFFYRSTAPVCHFPVWLFVMKGVAAQCYPPNLLITTPTFSFEYPRLCLQGPFYFPLLIFMLSRPFRRSTCPTPTLSPPLAFPRLTPPINATPPRCISSGLRFFSSHESKDRSPVFLSRRIVAFSLPPFPVSRLRFLSSHCNILFTSFGLLLAAPSVDR